MANKQKGDFDNFQKGLKNVIDSFEKAREWADLSNCLQKVKKHFDQNPGLEIPMKKDLAKRLAQCLNPDLSVIHQTTVEVYGIIFSRQIELMKENKTEGALEWGSDLGLFYSGLFNFYQFAAFEVKGPFLQIIEDHFLQLEQELLISLPGFMVCMLPALEDQNAAILKKVETILSRTEMIVGTSEFFGEIWKAMLRTPRARLSAIKYLEKRIPKDMEAARQAAKTGLVYISKYTLRIHELKLTLLKDPHRESEEIKKLEFMSLDDYFYFYYPVKERLAINSLLAGLQDSSVYVNRGVLDFLISHMPITGNINSLSENVRLVEGALMTLYRKDFAFLKKFSTWFLSHLEDEEVRPSQDDPTIQTLVPALQTMFVKYIEKSGPGAGQGAEKWSPSQPILILQTLLNDNSVIIEPVLELISVDLIKYIKRYYYDNQTRFHDNVHNLFDMVQHQLHCIWMALGSLLSEQIRRISAEYMQDAYSLEAIELIDFSLSDLKLGAERQVENFCFLLKPILSRLLSGVEKLSNSMNNLENALPALELIDRILKMLDTEDTIYEDIEHLKMSVDNFNNFYVNMCRLMTSLEEHEYHDNFKLRFNTFKKSSQILNQIQKYSNTYVLNQVPEWLSMVIECSKTKRAKIVLVSIETFLNILSKECKPLDPIKQLQNVIVKYDSSIRVDEGKSIYTTLQQTKNPYCTDIIKTLWSLLDEEEDHEKIVSLLKKFDALLPKIFSEVVTEELNSKDGDVKMRAIKKFSIFWKLTANDYPKYKPFYEKDTDLRRYVALHNMLHILDDNDPTLRLQCKSWLQESKLYYRRILDPLLEEFLANSKVFVTLTGQIFFFDNYETKIVIQNFGKMRNIILNTQEDMIYYIMTRTATDYVQKVFDEMFGYMRPKKRELKCHNRYLEMIVFITLQFIMGQAVESVNEQLYQESQTVNASACEFMELILKSLEAQKEIANEIAHVIIDPILKTFRQSIDNQNYAMQVQLMNLLKVLFFQCNFDSNQSKADCERILKDPQLIKSIVKGMKNEVSFVRYHFIQFAVTIVPFMHSLIKSQDFTVHVKEFIDCFCDLLKHVDVSLFATQNTVYTVVQDDYKRVGPSKATVVHKTTTKLDTFVIQRKDNLKFQLINQESDIAQIVTGLEQIINFCLGIVKDSNNTQSGANNDDFLQIGRTQQTDQTMGSKIKGFFSLGPFNRGDYAIIPHERNDVKYSIFEKFPNIIVSSLYCWNDLPIFLARDYSFTRSGIYPYTIEDEKNVAAIIEKSAEAKDGQPENLKAKESLHEYIKSQTNPIQKNVIDFLRPLAEQSPHPFIEGMLQVWLTKAHLDGLNLSKTLEKMMQVLISVRLSPNTVISSINKFIEKKNLQTKKAPSKKLCRLQRHDCQKESLLCHFLYSYLLYNISQQFKNEESSLDKIYYAVEKFIKFFYISKHPSTVCWLLEILFILSTKFTASDAYKIDSKLRKDFNDVLTTLLQNTAAILNDTFNIEFDKNYGFKIVYPPTVYELLKRFEFLIEKYQDGGAPSTHFQNQRGADPAGSIMRRAGFRPHDEDYDEDDDDENYEEHKMDGARGYPNDGYGKNGAAAMRFSQIGSLPISIDSLFHDPDERNNGYAVDEKDNVSQFMQELRGYISAGEQQCPSFLISKYFKFFTIITLKSILYPTVQNILVHNNHDKITAALSIIVSVIMQILNNKSKGEKEDPVIRETITDFFATIMDKANQLLVKPYKREITDLFFSDNFFQMGRRTLRKWCKILNHFIIDQKNEVFDDLVYKWNTQAGVFTSKDFEIKQKCIALKRVAFLVYSGDLDQYEDQLELLLKKMTEGFKTNKKYKDLRIQLFLLTRVLLMRLQPITLAEALRKLWPHLLNELVSIFEDKDMDVHLTFEAIKIIELMSCLNIEDFQMNQWIFLVDGYGMKCDVEPGRVISQFISNPGKKKALEDGTVTEADKKAGTFQPFIVKFMQKLNCSFYNQQKLDNISVQDLIANKKSLFEQRRTSININPENYSLDALMKYAVALQFHLNESNMERTEIDRFNAETLIEKDFIEPEKSFAA